MGWLSLLKFLPFKKYAVAVGLSAVIAGWLGWQLRDYTADRALAESKLTLVEYEKQVVLDATEATNLANQKLLQLRSLIGSIEQHRLIEKEQFLLESQELTERLRHAQETGAGNRILSDLLNDYIERLRQLQSGTLDSNTD